MLFSFRFRRSLWCCQHACRSHRASHLLPKSFRVNRLVHVNIELVGRLHDRPDSVCVSRAPSVCGLTGSLFLMRFVFSPACENPLESTTVRRTDYRSSQAEWWPHFCTGSSASHPVQACDLSRADDWRKFNGLRCGDIRDLPRGVHIASSTCLDSKAPLPMVLDV